MSPKPPRHPVWRRPRLDSSEAGAPQEQWPDRAEDTEVTARAHGRRESEGQMLERGGRALFWCKDDSLHGPQEVTTPEPRVKKDTHAQPPQAVPVPFRSQAGLPVSRVTAAGRIRSMLTNPRRTGPVLPSLMLWRRTPTSSRPDGVTVCLEGDVPDGPHCCQYTRRHHARTVRHIPRRGPAHSCSTAVCPEGISPF